MNQSKVIHSNTILSKLTIADCEELYEHSGYAAICNDGLLQGFIQEKNVSREHPSRLKLIWLQ